MPVHVALAPTRRDWPGLLAEFVHQLDDGRVYDRDLPSLARALEPVLRAYRRRAHMTGAPNVTEAQPSALLQYLEEDLAVLVSC